MSFYFLLNKLLDKNISKWVKVYLWNNFHKFHLSKQQMLSTWAAIGVYLPQEHQTAFPILLVSSSESDHSFPEHFPFTDSFETQGLHMYGHSFKKAEKYLSSEISFSSAPLFSSSEELFISSDFDIYDETCFIFKICLSFLNSLDISRRKALRTNFFWTQWHQWSERD